MSDTEGTPATEEPEGSLEAVFNRFQHSALMAEFKKLREEIAGTPPAPPLASEAIETIAQARDDAVAFLRHEIEAMKAEIAMLLSTPQPPPQA